MGLLEELLPKFGNHAMILEKSLAAYLGTLPEQRAAMHSALAEERRTDLRKSVHRIKGSLGYFGTPGMVAECQVIEESTEAAPVDQLKSLVEALDSKIQSLASELEAVMVELKSSK